MDGWKVRWMEGWIDGLISIMKSMHTVEYYTAMKRSEALTQATTGMHLELTLLSERESITEEPQCAIPRTGNFQNRQARRDRK